MTIKQLIDSLIVKLSLSPSRKLEGVEDPITDDEVSALVKVSEWLRTNSEEVET